MQEPFGKTLRISVLGMPPHIIYDPLLGGTSFLVTKIVAKKLSFIPKFIPAMNNDAYFDQVRNSNQLCHI